MTEKKSTVDVANSLVAPRSNYASVLEEIVQGGFCPFCIEHLPKHHANPILFENDAWLVTTNAWPYEGTRHHFLLIAKRHIESAHDLLPEEWAALGAAHTHVQDLFSLPASTLFMRSGKTAYTGASVNHLHAQIVVGYERVPDATSITILAGFAKK